MPEIVASPRSRKSRKNDVPGRSAYAVASELKRSSGLSVGELAERLGMSYMGVKAQCLSLERSGHLVSRNRHSGSGRPNLIYRLSARGQELFRKTDNGLALSLLAGARSLFGQASAEKLLFLHFQKLGAGYAEKLFSLSGAERVGRLAEIRDAEGRMARAEGGVLVESHCPLEDLFAEYPGAVAMEEAAISKALGIRVSRRVESHGDHYEIRFEAFRCGT